MYKRWREDQDHGPRKSARLQQQKGYQDHDLPPSPSPSPSTCLLPNKSSNEHKNTQEPDSAPPDNNHFHNLKRGEPDQTPIKTVDYNIYHEPHSNLVKVVHDTPQSEESRSEQAKQADIQDPPSTHTKTSKQSPDPINYWIIHQHWPEKFADKIYIDGTHNMSSQPSSSGISPYKRPRTSSYTQSVKAGGTPRQYTSAYQKWIAEKGLVMNVILGLQLVSQDSKDVCENLQQAEYQSITPNVFPLDRILSVIEHCEARKEGIVNRDITPLIIPPILSLYLSGEAKLEHVIDEVRLDWKENCVLAGPTPQPDLAVGLSASTFSKDEHKKLDSYKSVDNWTAFTEDMFFPAFLCEVKCGKDGLDMADRQNMHSSSIAVRAILRLVEEADRYRGEEEYNSLLGKVLVFSISHDQQDARLYGHFAKLNGTLKYYRFLIKKYNFYDEQDLTSIHNFVRRMLNSHFPEHIKRIKQALAVLPDPSTVSMTTSEVNLNDNTQPLSQPELSAGDEACIFKVPSLPASALAEIHKIRAEAESERQGAREREKQAEEREKQAEEREKKTEKEMAQMKQLMEQQSQQLQALLQRLDQSKAD